ncbi:ribosomal protein S5 domain 2-type protein [Roridomyces roridus]|uniref:Ribosomal protein S5 domain 2-type protein n=1 Tax=Roridomyces roridus TaxID=1738132 RepID=A0AAD7CFT7_9AGAR|nr:ribosomal protein S5 domain 2-type protein [Roridomyces roridus]
MYQYYLRPPPSWAASLRRPYATFDQGHWPNPLHASSPLTDRKSTFLAYASVLTDPATFPEFLANLRALPGTNIKRATHCMYAFRAAGVAHQSDGGEGGSGDRLARLLQLSGSEDVVVVVWRWYGGVKLGSDRWKCISKVAMEALDKGGFRHGPEEQEQRKKKKR